ncbi:MAG: magnesium-translocating P-type ATPase [Bacilli bacterium]|nr:magnesium-translocating P-type ATPase [Bacilli bacterium]MBQ7240997.1 magnesium-translocating P-type ATPase [Bacilli bacterium]
MNTELSYKDLSNKSKEEIMDFFKTNEEGLNKNEITKRLEEYGENIATNRKKKTPLFFIIEALKDKFVLILILLAAIDFITDDRIGAFIILGITLISVIIRFTQDYSTYRFNEKLKEQIRIFTDVIRGGKQKEVRQEKVVYGDIITLSAGSVIPADLYLFESKDLFINQSSFTGESAAVEKNINIESDSTDPIEINNICLMGCNVISGQGKGIVVKTGLDTFIGNMNKKKEVVKEETTFDKGMNHITGLLIKCMVIICILVFIIYGMIRGNMNEAILFALSVAVGITPSMLPMIVNVNLTKGSKSLAKKNTLVKSIKSIQNLGSMDTLCTDKTGTLTKNNIELQKYINVDGEHDDYVLKCAYVNSYLSTGYKNIVDKAIIQYAKSHNVDISNYKKIDEIPFDYIRKRSSIVVTHHDKYRIIAKGALEEITKVCDMARVNGKEVPINKEIIEKVNKNAEELAKDGMQVIALAIKPEYNGIDVFDVEDEKDFTLVGLIAFLDPPKPSAEVTIKELKEYGVDIKILTGDNAFATKSICNAVGIKSKIMTGKEIEELNDYELGKVVEEVDIFARMNPMQKERVVSILRKNGHSVGYMGDGVNDAPALTVSDVGISVDGGTDIAKESSDIILLEQNLEVIHNGVIEGRKVYGNILKYMKLALSQDFGDVFSILIASIFLPFLPLLPIQMLIQDFIVELSQIGIPYDNVDESFIRKVRKWDIKSIGRFMVIFGVISSITDVVAFIVFWFILKYNSIELQAFFQTAWFIECIVTETFMIFYIRTNHITKSRPSNILLLLTFLTLVATITVPMLLSFTTGFNFVLLPGIYYLYLIGFVILYGIIAQVVKKIYIKKYGEWF